MHTFKLALVVDTSSGCRWNGSYENDILLSGGPAVVHYSTIHCGVLSRAAVPCSPCSQQLAAATSRARCAFAVSPSSQPACVRHVPSLLCSCVLLSRLTSTQPLPATAFVSPALPGGSALAESAPALKACLRYLTSASSASLSVDVESAFFDCMCEMVEGRCSEAQIGAFLAALTTDRLTPNILAACARALRDHAVPVSLPPSVAGCMDIVGTGGDGADSFNVSTASALIVAASGVTVVKHGNRSSSSKCGSADLIEATGAALSLSASQAADCVARTNFCFLFSAELPSSNETRQRSTQAARHTNRVQRARPAVQPRHPFLLS